MTALDVLVQCAWKGSLLLGAGFVAAALLRRKSAALRHTVWTVCFAALLALPAAMAWMPGWKAPVRQGTVTIATVSAASMDDTNAALAPVAQRSTAPLPLLVWAGGAGVMALWFLFGIARTSRMVRRASTDAAATEAARSLGMSRSVRVLTSDAAPMPLMWGVRRPVVVLPAQAREWTEARLRTVLLHELVHVKRRDLLAQAIGQAACCFYWMNPLVWIAARQLRKEREQACDDAVLARGIPAPEYAGLLLDLVRAMAARRNAWSQAPAMAEASGLESRVRALLDPRRDRRPLNRRKTAGVALAGMVFLLPLAAHEEAIMVRQPNLVPSIAPVAAPQVVMTTTPVHRLPKKLVAWAAVAAPVPVPQAGSIAGTVRDPSGAVVPNCEVVIATVGGAGKQTMVTDNVGAFHFDGLSDGVYNVEVRAPGFKITKLAAMPVTNGNAVQANINLRLGEVTEAVEVTGHKPSSMVAPQDAVPPQRIKVGGNVQMTRLVRQPRPAYPPELQQLGVEGTVQLQVIISKDGVPINLKVINNGVDQRLVPLAVDAVQQWRYSPTLLNGEPVETLTTIDVSFKLN